jgi:alkylhydroperoxidase/carboxymuconolactone decarboxylase family protein YurZ
MRVTLQELRALARARTADLADGEPLDAVSAALIGVGLAAAVTALDGARLESALAAAVAAGATTEQLAETTALVSGLGVHSLMAAAPLILRSARRRGELAEAALDPARQALWDETVGGSRYWEPFERELPGFLDALVRLSPAMFRAFMDYCAVPWRGVAVSALTKELVSLAVDATPGHRFRPGFRLHLEHAIARGAGRRAIEETLDLAAACPPHDGFG